MGQLIVACFVLVLLLACSRQEALEHELERYVVRRQPLGYDRHLRSYWWGLGHHKTSLLVQEDREAVANNLAHLEAVATRGVSLNPSPAGAGGAVSEGYDGVREGSAAAPDATGVATAAPGADAAAAGSGGVVGGSMSGVSTDATAAPAADGANGGAARRAVVSGTGGIEAWGVLEQAEGVEALMGSCDVRGVREKELKGNLEKVSRALTFGTDDSQQVERMADELLCLCIMEVLWFE